MVRRNFIKESVLVGGGAGVISALMGLKSLLLGRPAARASDSDASAKGAPAKGRHLETMSWPEAESALKPQTIIVLPIGARTKEHGLHLPLNNDWIMAEYLTRRVLDACDAVALPTIEYGYFPAFTEYPGSVSISSDVFRDTVVDICRSIHRFGPSKFYLLNTGISTLKPLEACRAILKQQGIQVAYTDLRLGLREAEAKVRVSKIGTHADEVETSMMLYIAPQIVKMNLAKDDSHPDGGPGPLTRKPGVKDSTYSPTGAWGNPTLATHEKGRELVEGLVSHIIEAVRGLAQETAGISEK